MLVAVGLFCLLHDWIGTHYDVLKDFAGPVAIITAAVTAALITSYFVRGQIRIAEQQAKIAEEMAKLSAIRFRHEVYDRCYSVYQATRAFVIGEIIVTADVSQDAMNAFVRGISDAPFLVDDDLVAYLECLRNKAITLRNAILNMDRPEAAEERPKYVQQKWDLLNWFDQRIPVLTEKFKPFLSLAEQKDA